MAAKQHLDRVITSEPVDRVAARVTSSGTHWSPKMKDYPTHYHSELPIPTITPPRDLKHLIGVSFGRFVVMGFVGQPQREVTQLDGRSITSRREGGASWLVRCL